MAVRGGEYRPPKKPKPKEVAGPYRSQSSNPKIRREATAYEHRKVVPGATTTPSVTAPGVRTSGYPRPRSAKRAREARKRRQATAYLKRSEQRRRTREIKATEERPKRYEPNPAKAVISSTPNPKAKPPTFQGLKTAGAPTRQELRKASRAGTLKVNRKGFATTPAVRKTARQLKHLQKKARKSTGPLPGLSPRQSHVARKVLRTGDEEGATRKEKLAAAETGLVESGFENLSGGDADSAGWRQERAMYYPNPTNVKAAAKRFFQESISDTGGSRGRGQTAGELAQTIQASAYPERYDERRPEALKILNAYERGSLKPKEQAKLRRIRGRARSLGLASGRLGHAGQTAVGKAPKKVVKRFKAAQLAAKELEKARLPYVWGGGHGDPESSPTGGGLDCSGAVSYVLNKMGALEGSLVSGEMGTALEPGPGAVTVFYNSGHTFMRIGNRYFGTSATNPGGGAGFIEGTPDDLSKYSVGHVPGMGKKVALQMGLKVPEGGQSFPGMTISGSTATINPSAGVTQQKPGFSKKPITPLQRYQRTAKRLREAGVGERKAEPEVSVTIKELERKYG